MQQEEYKKGERYGFFISTSVVIVTSKVYVKKGELNDIMG